MRGFFSPALYKTTLCLCYLLFIILPVKQGTHVVFDHSLVQQVSSGIVYVTAPPRGHVQMYIRTLHSMRAFMYAILMQL